MSDFETSRVGPILADLLMGAAYADKEFDGREDETVRAKLRAWFDVPELPTELDERLKSFESSTFDLESTAALLGIVERDEALKVLEIVAAVHEADDELDLDEDAYLRTLAKCLGVDEADYTDLQLEIVSIEDLQKDLATLSSKPPPIPKD